MYNIRLFKNYMNPCFDTIEANIIPRIGEHFYRDEYASEWLKVKDITYSDLIVPSFIDCLVEVDELPDDEEDEIIE